MLPDKIMYSQMQKLHRILDKRHIEHYQFRVPRNASPLLSVFLQLKARQI